jgi:hypothetical protein
MSTIDIDKADIVDDSHVREALDNAYRTDEAARKRALIWTWGRAALLGGIGIGALCIGASFLIQPKIIERQVVVHDAPKPIETPRGETPKPVEPPQQVAGNAPKHEPAPTNKTPVEGRAPETTWGGTPLPKPRLEPPAPVAAAPKPDGDGDPFYKAFVTWCEEYWYRPRLCVRVPKPVETKAPNTEQRPWDALNDQRYFGHHH